MFFGRLLLAIVLFFLLRKALTWAFHGLSSLMGKPEKQVRQNGPEAKGDARPAKELSDQRIEEAEYEELP